MATRLGFDFKFLGPTLPFPKFNKKPLAPLLKEKGNEIKFTHFSVFVHAQRRLPFLAAVNIKGEKYNASTRTGKEPWKHSSDIKQTYQIDDRFYANDDNTFDRGHLVRRVDPCWGDDKLSSQGEADTFTWVNCTPQHLKINRQGGVWFQLEQHIMEHGVKNKIGDVSVFSGPVLASDDPVFIRNYENEPVPIPTSFWKVIVWRKSDGKLYAVGFLMNQAEWLKGKIKTVPKLRGAKPKLSDDYFEKLKFKGGKTYQVAITDIEKLTGIQFNWKGVSFPFTDKPKAVRGIRLNKVYAFKDVIETKKRVRPLRRSEISKKSVETELQKLPPLPSEKVEKLAALGEAYQVRQYKLTNITL